jgi:hypothetical protein
VILILEVIIVDKKHNLHNNTLADVSKKEQICCRDNAPDEQDLAFPPPFPLEAYVKNGKTKKIV